MTFGPRGSCNRQVFFWKLGASITVERTAKSSNRMDVVTLVPSNAISSGAIAIAEGTFPQFRQLAHNSGRCCQQCQSLGALGCSFGLRKFPEKISDRKKLQVLSRLLMVAWFFWPSFTFSSKISSSRSEGVKIVHSSWQRKFQLVVFWLILNGHG